MTGIERSSGNGEWKFYSNQLGMACFPKLYKTLIQGVQNEHFLEIIWSGIYRQLFNFFLKPCCVGKLLEFQKSKLRVFCYNQLFKYVEQLPVTVLFFLFRAFVWNIFNLLLMASLSLRSPKSGYSVVVIRNPEL